VYDVAYRAIFFWGSFMSSFNSQRLTPAELIDSAPRFAKDVIALADELGLPLRDYACDHIALRVNDWQACESLYRDWLALGQELSCAEINGRPIVVFELSQPLTVLDWTVACVELPYPSDKRYPQEGWEHMEWVIPSQALTVEAFADELKERFALLAELWRGGKLAAMGVTVKLSTPSGEGERWANHSVAFSRNGICIKLHPLSLKEVVLSERVSFFKMNSRDESQR
jgi:predicted metalloenzyme YecM